MLLTTSLLTGYRGSKKEKFKSETGTLIKYYSEQIFCLCNRGGLTYGESRKILRYFVKSQDFNKRVRS